MMISIRPAPHAKACALGKTEGCNNHDPSRCRAECNSCCEMKHCWRIGEYLQAELEKRGHTVHMADFARQLADNDTDAEKNTREEIDRLMNMGSQFHLAIHTNSASSPNVRRVSVGYKAGSTEGLYAAEKMAEALRGVYPGTVNTCTYPFIELNRPACLALYLEMGFANSNREDAEWLHSRVKEIAAAIADGTENIFAQEKEDMHMLYQAKVTCTYDTGIGIWLDNDKRVRLALVPKGEVVNVLKEKDEKGFCTVTFGTVRGFADGRYLAPLPQKSVNVVIPCKDAAAAEMLLSMLKGAVAS